MIADHARDAMRFDENSKQKIKFGPLHLTVFRFEKATKSMKIIRVRRTVRIRICCSKNRVQLHGFWPNERYQCNGRHRSQCNAMCARKHCRETQNECSKNRVPTSSSVAIRCACSQSKQQRPACSRSSHPNGHSFNSIKYVIYYYYNFLCALCVKLILSRRWRNSYSSFVSFHIFSSPLHHRSSSACDYFLCCRLAKTSITPLAQSWPHAFFYLRVVQSTMAFYFVLRAVVLCV